MRIVLAHPAGSNWIKGEKDLAAVANRMAPLGLLSIASYLERSGHEVFVHDCLGPGARAGTEDELGRGPGAVPMNPLHHRPLRIVCCNNFRLRRVLQACAA